MGNTPTVYENGGHQNGNLRAMRATESVDTVESLVTISKEELEEKFAQIVVRRVAVLSKLHARMF